MANNQSDTLPTRHAAILQQAQKDKEKKEYDDNACLGLILIAMAYALDYVLPNSYLLDSPTIRSSQKLAWELCVSISGGCILLLVILNVVIWFCRCCLKSMRYANRHLKNLLRYTAVIIAANTLLRGVLIRMDIYKWFIVTATASVAVISYFMAIWTKDYFIAYAVSAPQSLEVLLTLQGGGFDGATEAPPHPDPHPIPLAIQAAGIGLFRCLKKTLEWINDVDGV